MSSVLCGRCTAPALRSSRHKVIGDNIILSSTIPLWKGNRLHSDIERHSIVTLQFPSRTSRRYASSSKKRPSSAASVSKPAPSLSSTASTSVASTVNPPASTLPAELDLPVPASPSASLREKFTRYISIGRAYLTFYKTGLKNVYHNYKASMPVRRSLGLPLYLPTSPPAPPSTGSKGTSGSALHTAIDSLNISRADFQLVRRAAHDVRRMIPFTLLLIICGEFTPLVVLAVGDAVTPFTCRVPKQIDKARMQRAQRKRPVLAAVQGGLGSATPISPGSAEEMTWLADNFGDQTFAATASGEQVLRACAVFGLAKSHERPQPLVPLIYRPRLQRWTEYLALDDRLIVRGGGVMAMSAEEVRIAVDERGGVGIGVATAQPLARVSNAEKVEREWLEKWLKRRQVSGK